MRVDPQEIERIRKWVCNKTLGEPLPIFFLSDHLDGISILLARIDELQKALDEAKKI